MNSLNKKQMKIYIINETSRIVRENKINLGAYTKIDWINVYFEKAKNTSDVL